MKLKILVLFFVLLALISLAACKDKEVFDSNVTDSIVSNLESNISQNADTNTENTVSNSGSYSSKESATSKDNTSKDDDVLINSSETGNALPIVGIEDNDSSEAVTSSNKTPVSSSTVTEPTSSVPSQSGNQNSGNDNGGSENEEPADSSSTVVTSSDGVITLPMLPLK